MVVVVVVVISRNRSSRHGKHSRSCMCQRWRKTRGSSRSLRPGRRHGPGASPSPNESWSFSESESQSELQS